MTQFYKHYLNEQCSKISNDKKAIFRGVLKDELRIANKHTVTEVIFSMKEESPEKKKRKAGESLASSTKRLHAETKSMADSLKKALTSYAQGESQVDSVYDCIEAISQQTNAEIVASEITNAYQGAHKSFKDLLNSEDARFIQQVLKCLNKLTDEFLIKLFELENQLGNTTFFSLLLDAILNKIDRVSEAFISLLVPLTPEQSAHLLSAIHKNSDHVKFDGLSILLVIYLYISELGEGVDEDKIELIEKVLDILISKIVTLSTEQISDLLLQSPQSDDSLYKGITALWVACDIVDTIVLKDDETDASEQQPYLVFDFMRHIEKLTPEQALGLMQSAPLHEEHKKQGVTLFWQACKLVSKDQPYLLYSLIKHIEKLTPEQALGLMQSAPLHKEHPDQGKIVLWEACELTSEDNELFLLEYFIEHIKRLTPEQALSLMQMQSAPRYLSVHKELIKQGEIVLWQACELALEDNLLDVLNSFIDHIKRLTPEQALGLMKSAPLHEKHPEQGVTLLWQACELALKDQPELLDSFIEHIKKLTREQALGLMQIAPQHHSHPNFEQAVLSLAYRLALNNQPALLEAFDPFLHKISPENFSNYVTTRQSIQGNFCTAQVNTQTQEKKGEKLHIIFGLPACFLNSPLEKNDLTKYISLFEYLETSAFDLKLLTKLLDHYPSLSLIQKEAIKAMGANITSFDKDKWLHFIDLMDKFETVCGMPKMITMAESYMQTLEELNNALKATEKAKPKIANSDLINGSFYWLYEKLSNLATKYAKRVTVTPEIKEKLLSCQISCLQNIDGHNPKLHEMANECLYSLHYTLEIPNESPEAKLTRLSETIRSVLIVIYYKKLEKAEIDDELMRVLFEATNKYQDICLQNKSNLGMKKIPEDWWGYEWLTSHISQNLDSFCFKFSETFHAKLSKLVEQKNNKHITDLQSQIVELQTQITKLSAKQAEKLNGSKSTNEPHFFKGPSY